MKNGNESKEVQMGYFCFDSNEEANRKRSARLTRKPGDDKEATDGQPSKPSILTYNPASIFNA
jgi:hypothetical protein